MAARCAISSPATVWPSTNAERVKCKRLLDQIQTDLDRLSLGIARTNGRLARMEAQATRVEARKRS